ncbi:hypothetical protein [Chitinophaga sp. sic0106]|uniref:hypothetical protein n=1 Tax=Chitinophaga sp. sic0106 TaxID=2854785 RepID=UPI001C4403B7|nr:hypothetical protein [Chitinophaga sp. sic0106]MBV7534044.1 hypothetical protein [Chitinophaga sp. sic0106]
MTLNQLNQLLKGFVSDHPQLNSFGRGGYEELQASKDIVYPLMWVASYDGRHADKQMQRNIQIVFADLLKEDKSNELEVQSDMEQVALDLIALLRDNPDYDFQVDDSIQILLFTERFVDFTAGVFITFTFRDPKPYDRCEIPSN